MVPNQSWDKYVLHKIPTELGAYRAAGDTLTNELKTFDDIHMVSTPEPKQLGAPEERAGKVFYLMVIPLDSNAGDIRSSISLFGRWCDLRKIISCDEGTECQKFHQLGQAFRGEKTAILIWRNIGLTPSCIRDTAGLGVEVEVRVARRWVPIPSIYSPGKAK